MQSEREGMVPTLDYKSNLANEKINLQRHELNSIRSILNSIVTQHERVSRLYRSVAAIIIINTTITIIVTSTVWSKLVTLNVETHARLHLLLFCQQS